MLLQSRVLVTGISGFLGAHVVDELLKQGYRVRGTVRTAKIARHQEAYASLGDRVEIVTIDDLIEGDFSAALKGVDALIHVASPVPGRGTSPEDTLNGAIEGTVNVLRQAQKAGVKQISIASSLASCADITAQKDHYTEKDWNPTTREQALASSSSMYAYCASKALAEKAVWKIADQHPELNIATVNPNFFIGPFAPRFILEPGNASGLSSNLVFYNILLPDSTIPTPSFGYVDVRDVARALVAGMKKKGRNRILLSGEWFQHKDAIDYIASVRPELKSRLPTLESTGQTESVVDNARAVEILGIQLPRPWKESVLDTVDELIRVEKNWAAEGVDVDTVLGQNEFRKMDI